MEYIDNRLNDINKALKKIRSVKRAFGLLAPWSSYKRYLKAQRDVLRWEKLLFKKQKNGVLPEYSDKSYYQDLFSV